MTKKLKSPAKQEQIRDEHGRFVPGVSGNPAGRPPNEHSLTVMFKTILDEKPETKRRLVQKVITMAESGDMNAIKLLWQYIDGMPKQRVETEDVTPEDSEELTLLRSIVAKHEGTRKPLPGQRKTN